MSPIVTHGHADFPSDFLSEGKLRFSRDCSGDRRALSVDGSF